MSHTNISVFKMSHTNISVFKMSHTNISVFKILFVKVFLMISKKNTNLQKQPWNLKRMEMYGTILWRMQTRKCLIQPTRSDRERKWFLSLWVKEWRYSSSALWCLRKKKCLTRRYSHLFLGRSCSISIIWCF